MDALGMVLALTLRIVACVNAHAASGIMHANWSFREWSLMMSGSLLFDLERAKTMRHEIESRHGPLPVPISERID